MINFKILSSNAIKILACIFMLVDHIGVYLFPSVSILRIIGRLSFPLFAFFIAEGCKYTKHRIKRLLLMFVCALGCVVLFNVFLGMIKGNVLITFTCSIILIYAYQFLLEKLYTKNTSKIDKTIYIFLFLVMLFILFVVSFLTRCDYGFFGVVTPLLVFMFDNDVYKNNKVKFNLKLVGLFVGLTLIILSREAIQLYSYFSLCILLLYNNKKGNLNLKYLFYLFYPAHLLVIYLFTFL